MNIPLYFNIPIQSFAPLSNDIINKRTTNMENPAILFNYRESRTTRHESNQLGLRLLLVNAKAGRVQNSHALAQSGVIKTGDIILTFRPEWYGTLRYSHIQLGVSHAGIAYVDTASDGKEYVYNLDMPMDVEFMGPKIQLARMDANHYNELSFVHIVRLKDMNETQRANLMKWIKLLLQQKPYKSKLFFNTDYTSPKFTAGQPLTFVGDMGRIALGEKISQTLNVYCSEFTWAMLSLRNCDPDKHASDFRSQGAPACITEAFPPMPLVGDLYDGKGIIGLSDGPTVVLDIAGMNPKARAEYLRRGVFEKADGKPEAISSGHREVEKGLLSQNPQFYEYVRAYYNLTDNNMLSLMPPEKKQEMFMQRQGIKQQFNASQKMNYSPTSFIMHAILPQSFKGIPVDKRLDYVATIAWSPFKVKVPKKDASGNFVKDSKGEIVEEAKVIDLYQTFKKINAQ